MQNTVCGVKASRPRVTQEELDGFSNLPEAGRRWSLGHHAQPVLLQSVIVEGSSRAQAPDDSEGRKVCYSTGINLWLSQLTEDL